MDNLALMQSLQDANDSKLVLMVLDGLGGLGMEAGGPTELEYANTPNMDRLASEGTLGQTIPIRPGITPGSGPAHLSLFGYDPIEFDVGRGVLEAFGINLEVRPGDVAARGNFCTLDSEGRIIDRRAGRISSEEARPLVERLSKIEVPGARFEVGHVKEYRFCVVLRGEDYGADLEDTDPQETGVPPLRPRAENPKSETTAGLFQAWIEAACRALADQPKANGLTLRGFSTDPQLPQFPEIFGLRAACVAVYPMYKGVSKLVGMQVLSFDGDQPEHEFEAVAQAWNDFDFFFIHIKKTDSMGEDGNFEGKARIIETVDAALPTLLALGPTVLAITGDHSTPSRMRIHTWHPVPFLLWAPATVRRDMQERFGETACASGGLGTMHGTSAMPLMMAHAGRFEKYGA